MPRVVARAGRACWSDERGSAALLAVPMIAVLLGVAAISVDMMNGFTAQEQLRTAAEAAATAAVSKLPDEAAALDAAIVFGEKNSPYAATGTIISESEVEFGRWHQDTRTFEPDPDVEMVNAVRVVASLKASKDNPLQTWFGVVLGKPVFDVSSSAIAALGGSIPCIVALDPTGPQAITLKSNTVVNVPNCEVHGLSSASDALYTDSEAGITASRICVAGDYSQLSNSDVAPEPETACEPVADPFAHVSPPSVGGCVGSGKTVDNRPETLTPGVYCGGLQIKNNAVVTFSPGVYVIKDGKFLVDSNSRITGDGVTFYLTGASALLDFTSNTQVNLKAPKSGAMAGMIFFQDRNFGGEHKFDSNVAAVLEGALYFPKGTFKSDSNTNLASASSCTTLVAHRIKFDSNSRMNMLGNLMDCPWLLNVMAVKRTTVVG